VVEAAYKLDVDIESSWARDNIENNRALTPGPLRATIATVAGVEPNDVLLVASPGSIIVHALISSATVSLGTIKSNIQANLGSASQVTSAFGVKCESVVMIRDSTLVTSTSEINNAVVAGGANAFSNAIKKAAGLATGVLVAIIVAPIVSVCCLISCIVYFCCIKPRSKTKVISTTA